MHSSLKLLDKYAETCGLKKGQDLAARLRVTSAAVSGWRHGKSQPDAESVARMCDATGESLAYWLPLIEAERARNPEAKRVWLRLAQAAAVITLALGLDVHTAKAEAISSSHAQFTKPMPIYIMRSYGWS